MGGRFERATELKRTMWTGLQTTLALAAGAIVVGGLGLAAAAHGDVAALVAASLPLALSGIAIVLVLASFRQSRRQRALGDQLSREMDLISARLLRLEAQPLRAPDAPRELPADMPAGMPADMAELCDDVGILSRTVASLADAMARQERDLAALKLRPDPERARPDPPRHDRPEPAPPPAAAWVVPSLLPNPASAPRADPEAASPEARREAIAAALDAGQIELHLQPVVTLPQRRVRFYEALARLRISDDAVLLPAEFIPTLERLGRVIRLDGLVLTRAVAAARQLAMRGAEVAISCNLSPASLKDPAFLEAAERIIADDPQASRRLILEISQRSWRNTASFEESVSRLSALGVAFALDRATDLTIDAERLARLGVRYAKMPADQLLAEDEGRIAKLVADLTASGIQLVAERVEKEELVPELLEIRAGLAQGFVFGMPRLIRAGSSDLAAPSAAPAPDAGVPPAIPVATGPSERLSLKSILRRAG